MSEENDNQPAPQTDTQSDRPRRPRRRFPRRHSGPRDRGPQEQRGDLNGPSERVESSAGDDTGGAPRVNEGDPRDESTRGDGGPSQNGEIEREPEYGDGIIEISSRLRCT